MRSFWLAVFGLGLLVLPRAENSLNSMTNTPINLSLPPQIAAWEAFFSSAPFRSVPNSRKVELYVQASHLADLAGRWAQALVWWQLARTLDPPAAVQSGVLPVAWALRVGQPELARNLLIDLGPQLTASQQNWCTFALAKAEGRETPAAVRTWLAGQKPEDWDPLWLWLALRFSDLRPGPAYAADKVASLLNRRYPGAPEALLAEGTALDWSLYLPATAQAVLRSSTAVQKPAPPAVTPAKAPVLPKVRFQVGVFRQKNNAEGLAARLKTQGFEIELQARPEGWGVVVFSEKGETALSRLKQLGFKPLLLSP